MIRYIYKQKSLDPSYIEDKLETAYIPDDKRVFFKKLVFEILTKSSYFGGRVLLPKEYFVSRYSSK